MSGNAYDFWQDPRHGTKHLSPNPRPVLPAAESIPRSIPTSQGLDSGGVRELRNSDPTNPTHYANFTVEPIDAIESWGLGYNLASVVSYIARAGRKPAGEIRSANSGVLGPNRAPSRPDGHAKGVRVGSGLGRGDDHAVELGRRLDLRKALRYLIREITALDGEPSWDFADISWGDHA